MTSTNIANFKKNMLAVFKQTIEYSVPTTVNTQVGDVVILGADDYNGLLETVYLSANPKLKKRIKDGLKTPLAQCIPESEVVW